MKISNVGLTLIKNFEGLRLKAYKVVESEKHYTIGYGHYGADVKKGQVITNTQAEQLLMMDLEKFVKAVDEAVKVKLNQNQFDALVSFTYNCGITAFKTSTLLIHVNAKDFVKASKEFKRWNKSGGKVLGGLVTRRDRECKLFIKPIPKENETLIQYKIKSGDTLSEIAKKYNTSVYAIMNLNKTITKPNYIVAGKTINIIKK